MMNSSEKPHRTTGTSELFICFTSRLSSSTSMKISSNSILSPGRPRDAGAVSLSTSLSRRLKNNRSLKGGGQSPMFPATAGRRRGGSGFENPEPSSPKVTCIGQVRVKTKKQGNKIRTLSKRRGGGGGGDGSFRRGLKKTRDGNFPLSSSINQLQHQESLPHHRNQRWVHLPLTICEALRGFGSEFSCLIPCRPSCFSNGESGKERERGSSERSRGGRGSCGDVFTRWLVAINDGERGKGREVELVVGGAEEVESRQRISLRRHVDEEIGIEDETCEVSEIGASEEEEGRVSVCIPPKNALLLMRCRSDPVRVSALANRFWESPAVKCEEEEGDYHDEKEGDHEVLKCDFRLLEAKEGEQSEKLSSTEANEEDEAEEYPEADVVEEVEEEGEENPEEEKLEAITHFLQEEDEEKNQEPEVEVEGNRLIIFSSPEAVTDREKLEIEDGVLIRNGEEAQMEERRASHSSSSVISVHLYSDDEEAAEAEAATVAKVDEEKTEEAALEIEEDKEETEEKSGEEKETQEIPFKMLEGEEDEQMVTQERSKSEQTQETESEEREKEGEERKLTLERKSSSPLLPDCLLLMRCEPKLSMEVSKETWVCTTDFIRWLPERQPKPTDGSDEPKKRVISFDSNPAHTAHDQPPRSSCTLPAAVAGVSMGTVIERKLVNAVAYEPFVLPRCKSEPVRTAAAKLKPETCFWKNRKLELHRRSTVGVGAAGVGF